MKPTNWPRILLRVWRREKAVRIIRDSLSEDFFAVGEISSTDIFVEKAEIELSERSARMFWCAFASLVFTVLVVIISLWFISGNFESLKIVAPKTRSGEQGILTTQLLVAGIVRNATLLGFVISTLYLSVSLFRAFLHEATILKNRVHSVRLGRLFVYLKYGSISHHESLEKVRQEISASELERIFGWNIETSTAFKDIDPSFMTKTIWSNVPDMVAALVGKKDK